MFLKTVSTHFASFGHFAVLILSLPETIFPTKIYLFKIFVDDDDKRRQQKGRQNPSVFKETPSWGMLGSLHSIFMPKQLLVRRRFLPTPRARFLKQTEKKGPQLRADHLHGQERTKLRADFVETHKESRSQTNGTDTRARLRLREAS